MVKLLTRLLKTSQFLTEYFFVRMYIVLKKTYSKRQIIDANNSVLIVLLAIFAIDHTIYTFY